MATNTKKIFDYIKNTIAERFRRYEKDDKPYSYTLSLSFRNNTPPDIKLATLETGATQFIGKFDEAVKQGISLGAEKLIFREYDDAELSSPVEHREMHQELPFNTSEGIGYAQPSRRKEKIPAPGLGLGEITAMVEKQMEPMKASLREKELKLDHERDLEKKDRLIEDLQNKLEKVKSEKDEEIQYLNDDIKDLQGQLKDAQENKWSKLPLGAILSDFATNFLRKNPAALSGFGIEDVSKLLGAAEGDQMPATQVASNAADQRTAIYDKLIEFCQSLDDESFLKFMQIALAIDNKTVSINDLHSLCMPAEQKTM